MLVNRVKIMINPDKRRQFLDAITKLVHASREAKGVISYDICESTTEPNTFIAIEVYE